MTSIDQVAEFHQLTNCPVLDEPIIPLGRIELRYNLIKEELEEFLDAASKGDVVGVADALTDLQYVLDGAFCEFGMKDIKEALFNEVHRSNMTKFCETEESAHYNVLRHRNGIDSTTAGVDCHFEKMGDKYVILRDKDGKVLKPSHYEKAQLVPIVFPVFADDDDELPW